MIKCEHCGNVSNSNERKAQNRCPTCGGILKLEKIEECFDKYVGIFQSGISFVYGTFERKNND